MGAAGLRQDGGSQQELAVPWAVCAHMAAAAFLARVERRGLPAAQHQPGMIHAQAANSGCLICLVLCCLSWIDNGEEEMLSCVLGFM